MLPSVLYLAAPRALALSGPHFIAATAVAIVPAACSAAVQFTNPRPRTSIQLYQQRSFHLWRRRSHARRYASWGREGPYGDAGQQTQETARQDELSGSQNLSPRERLWRAKMEMINRMMRADPYEGLFGPSNRMLRGLNWRDSGWRKMWEEQWKSMEKMEGDLQERARKLLQAFEKDAKYPDSEVAKRAEENDRVKKDLARHGWEYDPITNKMVQRRVDQEEETLSSPTSTPIPASHSKAVPATNVEATGEPIDIPVKVFKPNPETPVSPAPTTEQDAATKYQLPKEDLDLLTAEDVRARMGHLQSAPKESTTQKAEKRADLENKFTDIQQHVEEPIGAPSIHKVDQDQTLKFQHEQLKEAAADFQLREKRVRKEIRDLETLCQSLRSRLTGLVGRRDGLVRSGTISPQRGVQLDAIKGSLNGDVQILAKASNLITSAVLTAAKVSGRPTHMEPSLDRYAWDKKPFAKIRDAEELVRNSEVSLDFAECAISEAETALEKDVELASVLSGEVEGQKKAMQSHEEKWRWRQDVAKSGPTVVESSKPAAGADLVKEIRGIYEDHYGTIDTKHRQAEPIDELAEEALAAMHLGGIPEVSPASLDGGHYAGKAAVEDSATKDISEQTHQKPLVTYTILALDPTLGVTKATTTTTAPSFVEEPISLNEALRKLKQPARFLPALQGLKQHGFQPVSSSENMMVLKHFEDQASTPKTGEIAATSTRPGRESQSDAAANGDGAVYSTRLQSPTSSTFQGLKPRRVEPVFSGEQGGHVNYEKLRHHLRHQIRERRQRKGRYRRRFRKAASLIVTLAAACYLTGVASEALRDGKGGGDAAKQERDFVTGQLGRP